MKPSGIGIALAGSALAVTAAEGIKVTTDWPGYLGANNAFSETSGVRLVNDMTKVRFVWESEEKGIGFGKAVSSAGRDGYAAGTGLAYGGEASPIVAGGLVIQFYTAPCGETTWSDGEKVMGEKYKQFEGFWKIAADEMVIAMDAATGKTKWKQVFKDKGINYCPGKRGGFAVTPFATGGPSSSRTAPGQAKVFCMGTTGRLYCLDLASGKPLWESDVGTVHKAIEEYKANGLKNRTRSDIPGGRPYGMLTVVDGPADGGAGVLLAPDWSGGVVGVDTATGQRLWQAPNCVSGFNSPVPVKVQGKDFIACVNRLGEMRLLNHKTGAVLWTHALGSEHLTQPVFGGECLMVFESHPKFTGDQVGKSKTPNALGVLAGYRLTEKGAEKAWSLPPDYMEHLYLDGGPARKIVARQGIVYCWTLKVEGNGSDPKDTTARLAIVREKDGQVLGTHEVKGWNQYLWGDRLITVTDIQHRPRAANPEIWQMYNADPANFRPLGDGWHVNGSKPVHTATGGYEVPVLEPFADGLFFCRVWGGIRCYDLRALSPSDGDLAKSDPEVDPETATWEVTLKSFFDKHRPLDMILHRKNGQWTGYKITGMAWNIAWHKADLSRLSFKDGRLTGPVVVTLLPDKWMPADRSTNVVNVSIDATLKGRNVAGTFAGTFGGDGTNVVGKIRKLEG